MHALLLSLASILPLAPAGTDEHQWRERLFLTPIEFDELALVRFDPADLEHRLPVDPAVRAAELGKGIAQGEDDVRLRLELATLLATTGERENAHALFAELGYELGQRVEEEEGNWELAALFGEVLVGYADAFHDLESLHRGEALLRRAFDAQPTLWRAGEALAVVYLRQAIALRAAGDTQAAEAALAQAIEFAEQSVEVASHDFGAYATRFLVRWTATTRIAGGGTLGSALETIDQLRAACRYAPEPDWSTALADLLETSLLLAACEPAREPFDAFRALPEDRRARVRPLDDGLATILTHPTLGDAAWRLRWLLAFFGARADEPQLFEQALSKVDKPDLLLEGRLGLMARRGSSASMEELERELLKRRPDARTQDLFASLDVERAAFDDALEHYRASLQLDPNGRRALVGLAVAMLKKGDDPTHAISLLEPLAAAENPPPAALFALGTGYALEGEKERALERLSQALASSPLELRPRVQATIAELKAVK